MPVPGLTEGLIAAGATITSAGAQAAAQGKMNRRSIKYAREAYARQRQDALSDYATQNEYNSPKAQMQRFKEAGLNPNLIYGQQNEGATFRSSDTPVPDLKAADYSGIERAAGTGIQTYQNIRMNNAQVDQLRASITNAQQETLLKAAQTTNTLAQTESTKFDVSQKVRLADTNAQVMSATLDNLKQQTSSSQTSQRIALNEDQRRAALSSQSLIKGVSEILQIQAQTANTHQERRRILAQIENLEKDTDLKAEDLRLRKQNLPAGSGPLVTAITERVKPFLDANVPPIPTSWQEAKDRFNKNNIWEKFKRWNKK